MATADQRNRATNFLKKAEEYVVSAEVNLAAGRYTPAAGDAVHAGISAKDAIVSALTGSTTRGKDHASAVKELRAALGRRSESAASTRALRELLAAKSDVEYGAQMVTAAKAQPLVRRSRMLVDLAVGVVRVGR